MGLYVTKALSWMLVFKTPFVLFSFFFQVTGDAEKEVDLEQYFQINTPLHCTTKFCDYGKVEGAKEYTELQVGHSLEILGETVLE